MVLKIGTDCSGIEAPIQALKQLKIPFKHKWSCDNDHFVKQSIEANYKPEKFFIDITTRNHKKLPDIDLYVCGFPCQSFSLIGNRKGTEDARGNIMLECIEVIKYKLPKYFILENVKNFKFIQNGQIYNYLINELNDIKKYNIYSDILNTKDYGLPQNRERIFIIGIRKDINKEYKTPKHQKMKPLDDFIIDKTIYKLNKKNIPQWLYKKLISINFSSGFTCTNTFAYSPIKNYIRTLNTQCIVFHTTYNRYLSIKELLKLQGFPKNFKRVVSDSQLKKQIGNSMSVNVLKEILKQIL